MDSFDYDVVIIGTGFAESGPTAAEKRISTGELTMNPTPEPYGRHAAPGTQRRLLRSVFELWWNLDRRRHIARLAKGDRLHSLGEPSVVDAMARQLEEIRNLPEVAR